MKKYVLLIVLAFVGSIARAQFSVIQDGKGETSFQLFSSQTLLFNAEESAVGFSIRPKTLTNAKGEHYWTFTATANAKDGSGNVFKEGKFQFSGKFGANYISDKTNYKALSSNLIYNFIGFEGLYSRHNVFDGTQSFGDQLYDQTNLGFRINYGWNFLNIKLNEPIFEILGEFTSGISGSFGIKDNSSSIDQYEFITSTISVVSGTSTRTQSTTSNAYNATELSKNNLFGRINFDFAKYVIGKRALINLHLNYAIDEDLKNTLNPAIGIFATQKGAPLEAIVGMQLQTNDWTNSRNSKKNRWERTAVVLTVGFPFN